MRALVFLQLFYTFFFLLFSNSERQRGGEWFVCLDVWFRILLHLFEIGSGGNEGFSLYLSLWSVLVLRVVSNWIGGITSYSVCSPFQSINKLKSFVNLYTQDPKAHPIHQVITKEEQDMLRIKQVNENYKSPVFPRQPTNESVRMNGTTGKKSL